MASIVFPTYFLARLVVGREGGALRGRRGRGPFPRSRTPVHRRGDAGVPVLRRSASSSSRKTLVEWPPRGRKSYGWAIAAVWPPRRAGGARRARRHPDRARLRRSSSPSGRATGGVAAARLDALGLARASSRSRSGRSSSQRDREPPSQQWYGITMLLEAPDLRARQLGGRLARDRARRDPVVAGLIARSRAPGEEPSRELRMFRSVTFAAIVAVGMYTGMKAAYLSTVFATCVEERNIIYLARCCSSRTAIVLERRRVNYWALAGATLYAVVSRDRDAVPDGDQFPTRTRSASRSCSRRTASSGTGPPSTAQWVLLAILAVGLVGLVALPAVRSRTRVAACRGRARGRVSSAGTSPARSAPQRARTRSAAAPRRRSAIRSPGWTTSRTSSRRSTSAREKRTRTRSGCSSSGTARSSPSAASTAASTVRAPPARRT